MYSFTVFIILFILSICIVSSHERAKLRGLHQYHMNKSLNEEIQRIVEKVIKLSKENQTTYTISSYVPTNRPDDIRYIGILSKFSDKIIINRLHNILINTDITISKPKCCTNYNGCEKHEISVCKFIVINW